MLIPLTLAVALLAQAQVVSLSQPQAAVSAPAAKPAAPPANLESYQLVVLQRPEHPRDYPADKLEEIQKAHISHLRDLAKAGKLLVAGPLDDQPDPRWRGLELFRVESLAEAKQLAEDDPALSRRDALRPW